MRLSRLAAGRDRRPADRGPRRRKREPRALTAVMTHRAVLVSVLALGGCVETAEPCENGFARTPEGECVPYDAGSADAGPDAGLDASGDVDVAPDRRLVWGPASPTALRRPHHRKAAGAMQS